MIGWRKSVAELRHVLTPVLLSLLLIAAYLLAAHASRGSPAPVALPPPARSGP